MQFRAPAAVLATALLGAPGLGAARPALAPARLQELARYEVLLQSEPAGAGLQRHRVVGLFDATPEEVFRVATSYERYSEYMPRITTSHTLWQGEAGSVVLLEADLPWPMADTWVHARFQHELLDGASYRVRFGMLRGNLLRYEGTMLIEPGERGRALVTYELVAQPDSRLPRAWVQGAVGRGALNFVHCLRSRVSGVLQQRLLLGPAGAALYPVVLRHTEDGSPEEPPPRYGD